MTLLPGTRIWFTVNTATGYTKIVHATIIKQNNDPRYYTVKSDEYYQEHSLGKAWINLLINPNDILKELV